MDDKITVSRTPIFSALGNCDDAVNSMEMAKHTMFVALEVLDDDFSTPSSPTYNERVEQISNALKLALYSYCDSETELRKELDKIYNAIGIKT